MSDLAGAAALAHSAGNPTLSRFVKASQPQPFAAGMVDPLNLSPLVDDLLGFQGQVVSNQAAAEGARFTAQGAAAEADAYGISAGIAAENARTEAISEGVREIQQQTQIDQTVGAQKAATAANGFQQGGSSLDIMASTLQQGYLSQQISGMQSQQVQRGALEQQAAASGEMAAATARAGAATSLANQYDTASTSAAANQAAVTSAMTQLLAGDPNATQLITDLTAGDTSAVLADTLTYNPAGADQPLATVETGTTTGTVSAPTSTSFGATGTAGAPLPDTQGTPLATVGAGWNVKFV
jgi:trimeric autotransporter adhesin